MAQISTTRPSRRQRLGLGVRVSARSRQPFMIAIISDDVDITVIMGVGICDVDTADRGLDVLHRRLYKVLSASEQSLAQ